MKTTHHYNLSDTAKSCLHPLIDLGDSKFANLTALAPYYWIHCDHFDDFGPSMFIISEWRRLLAAGGLPVEWQSWRVVNFKTQKATEILQSLDNSIGGVEPKLKAIRLLMYLGFYSEALSKLNIFSGTNLEEQLWCEYLGELIRNLQASSVEPPINLARQLRASGECSPHARIQMGIFLSSMFLGANQGAESEYWYDQTMNLLEQSGISHNVRSLSKSRLIRQRSRGSLQTKNVALFEGEIAEALHYAGSILDDAPGAPSQISPLSPLSGWAYLRMEQCRRIHDFAAVSFLRLGCKDLAFSHAQQALSFDPWCSRAYMIAGDCALALGNAELANQYYAKGAETGIVERPYCLAMLGGTRVNDEFEAGIVESQTLDFFRSRSLPILLKRKLDHAKCKSWTCSDLTNYLPISEHSDATVHEKARPLQTDCVRALSLTARTKDDMINTSSDVYQRYLPFWELKRSFYESVPISAEGPLIAWDAYNSGSEPWFKSLYLQRALDLDFRIELANACSFFAFGIEGNRLSGTNLESLAPLSENMRFLVEECCRVDGFSLLKSCLLSRVVGSLGFHLLAFDLLPKAIDLTSIEGIYAEYTKLFMRHVGYLGTDKKITYDLKILYSAISDGADSLRMRLSCAILGSVIHGQRQDIEGTKYWRSEGLRSLEALHRSSLFSEFERKLLTSRFYRAVSYAPFLEKDQNVLRLDKEICEKMAREATPTNQAENVLYKENLFPMLESVARMEFALGNPERGMALMREIVEVVDPYDPKAWAQYGDLLNKEGKSEMALQAYLRAARLGPPIARISWFKAGRHYERRGDLVPAKRCYLRSLKVSPRGFTPLVDLMRVAATLKDDHLLDWCKVNLDNARASGEMASLIAEKYDGLKENQNLKN